MDMQRWGRSLAAGCR